MKVRLDVARLDDKRDTGQTFDTTHNNKKRRQRLVGGRSTKIGGLRTWRGSELR